MLIKIIGKKLRCRTCYEMFICKNNNTKICPSCRHVANNEIEKIRHLINTRPDLTTLGVSRVTNIPLERVRLCIKEIQRIGKK